jgi:RNA polymerase sigma-70 factor, ECF subfamily
MVQFSSTLRGGGGHSGGAKGWAAMNEMMDEDTNDLAEAKAGRPDAFARLYDRHAPVVFALCRRQFAADPEEAAQETFIRAFGNLEQLDDPNRFRPWLYRIAGNVCSEKRRAAGRRAKHEGAAMLNGTLLRQKRDGVDPSRVDHDEQLERLTAAMEQLSDQERLALHLYYLDKDPVKAAMPALGVSRSGYYKLLDRAKAKLAELLDITPGAKNTKNTKEVNR